MNTRSFLKPMMTGFTLMEILVALSLLSIVSGMAYSFYLFAHKQVVVRERKAFEFDNTLSLLESVAKNIRESRSTLLLEGSNWVFLTKSGDTASYKFADGTLKFNTLSLTIGGKPVSNFSFAGFGNDSLLDRNGDGEIDFNELDTDGDDKLTGEELEKLAWIRCTLSPRPEGNDTISTLESVKNNLASDDERLEKYF